jgi:glutamyl-Q tRNA(Asp) synthetase
MFPSDQRLAKAESMSSPVFRFAPSPNGYLHLGHAYSALLNFDAARQSGGRFLLRIEDIDATRCRPEFEAAIYEDLSWLGIVWEEPVRRQSDHLALYADAIAGLARQDLVYPSFESRAAIARAVEAWEKAGVVSGAWPRDPDGAPLYPGPAGALPSGACKKKPHAGAACALRLAMAKACQRAGELTWREQGGFDGGDTMVAAAPQAWGDVVLARKEIPTSYHLSVVLDDASQGVTHVVRGEDLFWASSVHRLLQRLLDLPEPIYRHHRLVRDESGRKLSKSSASTGLRALRANGASALDVRRMVGLSP